VYVTGHNWWWEFHYPDLGIKTANEFHVPIGAEIQMDLSSVDVLHTLSIPELSVQADAFPAATRQLQITVEAAGKYGGACSEVCGTAHNMMRVKLVAEPMAEFAAWAAKQRAPAAAPQTQQQIAGFEFVTSGCARCHSLNPAEPRSDLPGPNLAHLMSRSVFAGASFTLNEANLRRWMRDTQALKAGNAMIVNLRRDDYEAVIEYLLMLK
jgi:cytochrome c oxidase subunit 2